MDTSTQGYLRREKDRQLKAGNYFLHQNSPGANVEYGMGGDEEIILETQWYSIERP
ncbi:hypothetical protein M413DRAFT_440279 [Hebeloma cylindrosporum]|uniref:Uncharacterized protein n=1 Tax=Hebeloma cylindrosporum TaxID=76867 RepID=A0A0C2YA43_HEBCY|nr:hypothetical protein M413DRAFT_440279 [Hebeloma cylindrosporum h7]